MANQPQKTKLRMFRRRTCLSQKEIAFLLGSTEGSQVSRHEQGQRIPFLRTLLGYVFILGADLPSLYKGVYLEVQSDIRKRAKHLCRAVEREPQSPIRTQKIAVLQQIMTTDKEESERRLMF